MTKSDEGYRANGNMTDDEEEVVIASRGLEKAVQRLLDRYEKRKQKTVPSTVHKRVQGLVDHTRLLLETLKDKRRSLRTLMQYFHGEWLKKKSLEMLESHPLQVLQHFIQIFLRCQDGLVLLTSGECRHPGDIQQTKSCRQNHTSQLATLEMRNDGYTSLYRSDAVYSGLSFDEFANETVGIQARLTQLLAVCQGGQKDRVWEYLVNHGGQGIETLLDQHETEVKDLQQQLQNLKQQILHDIQKRLHPQKVTFVTNDKTERLVVVLPANHPSHHQKIVLERRANAFQIRDPEGVLPPTHKSVKDWSQAMMPLDLPTASTSIQESRRPLSSSDPNVSSSSRTSKQAGRRRRLVIEDSDSDQEELKQNRPPKSQQQRMDQRGDKQGTLPSATGTVKPAAGNTVGGLVVKVELAQPEKQETEESVAAIKTKMGADVQGLEIAREELEQELDNSAPKDGKHDNPYDQDEAAIRRGKRKVQRLRSILEQVRSRPNVDDNEVWDARECLREAYMTVGNDLLWSSSPLSGTTKTGTISSSDSMSSRLQDAHDYFGLARDTVVEQEKFHARLTKNTNDMLTVESRYMQRNLLLLRGQACVNLGIVLVEWSELEDTRPVAQRKYQAQAVQELQTAKTLASEMRHQATRDREQAGAPTALGWEDCMVDILKADQLDSLASRWMGLNLWRSQKQGDAEDEFARAWSFFLSRPILQRIELQDFPNILQMYLEVGTECIYACSTLADLACSAMEKLKIAASEHTKGDKMVAVVRVALEKQGRICAAIEKLKTKSPLVASAVQIFLEDSEFQQGDEIRKSLSEVESWWSNVKSQPEQTLDSLSTSALQSTRPLLPRSDLFGRSGQGNSIDNHGPTRRFIVAEGSQRAKRRHRSASGRSSRGSVRYAPDDAIHALNFEDDNEQRKEVKYRKWGDELLPQVVVNTETGETRPKIVYPAVAPPLPPEFKELFDMQRRNWSVARD